ncbi:MAG TPA: hypothetical protein VN419_03245 [Humidesulfovibrio sp.]|uniref:hypothetical protein n=1 Tax=Humidesulfovibrio sp. TaxID=2910988 RepID=UPI002CCB55A1|nr:hypothetical protein [Humidesulfovibrio sp.]HWR03014.1 hypothetical protein [Humidesulfovibrio sp.]
MKREQPCQCAPTPEAPAPEMLTPEVTEFDERLFAALIDTRLDAAAQARILTPGAVQPAQDSVLAVHWHPEHVPMGLIKQRIEASYPAARKSLIIPTQHNELMEYGPYTGVEVDCYSRGFNQKVQLLLHFRTEKLSDAHVLKSMLAHTHAYRSSQLFDYLTTVTRPDEERLAQAARESGSDEDVVAAARACCLKLEALLERHAGSMPVDAIKNKLVRNFVDGLRPQLGHGLANRVQVFLKEVKAVVKAQFPLTYFYRTTEFIEEARSLGGGVVIPHPEQFWPILLAGYDVDGYEVWNPQSQRYTEFLISVLYENNRRRGNGERRMLVFMGDDTHMGEKTLPVSGGDSSKARREIGLQPAWDDLSIGKKLIVADMDRVRIIEEYGARLDG